MYNPRLENNLISPDIVDVLQDYVSIQLDIDPTKIKAAATVAQNIDLRRVITQENLSRCITPSTESDDALRELIIPAWCYFTYARGLEMFPGTWTDSGYVIDTESVDKEVSQSVSSHMRSIADSYMEFVIEFLDNEDSGKGIKDEMTAKLSPKIRVFGGVERRASN